jgi:hypothetical protein
VDELEKVAHGFGEVVGLGLRNLAQCPVELNLVPKSIRSRQQFDQKKPYFIAAIFSLVLVVFAYGIFYGKIASVKRSSLDALNEQLQPLENRVQQLEVQENLIKATTNQISKLVAYLEDKFYWPDTLAEVRSVLTKVEASQTQPGRPVGVWIEKFGTVTGGAAEQAQSQQQEEQSGPSDPLAFYRRNPELMKRYFPQLYQQMYGNKSPDKPAEEGAEAGTATTTATAKASTTSTNQISVDIKLRALNLDKAGQSGLNNQLAYAVQEAFQKDPMFDSSGTKLAAEGVEKVEATADTFTFGLKLVLKKPMQTM